MRAVGIKVLKAQLSEYLRLVKTGETVLVTERDKVVAELCPARSQNPWPACLEEGLQRMAECGEAVLRSEKIRDWPGPATRIKLKGLSSKALLDTIREESI